MAKRENDRKAPQGGLEQQRIGALDGIRGLALIAVLAYHVAPGAARGGFLGVDIFFVLSGFLLATLLLEEHARTGAIDMLAYAARRVRRLRARAAGIPSRARARVAAAGAR